METRNLLIQIALLVLAGIILFKVFQMDANQKIIKNSIEKSLKEIESAEENLAAALDEITDLEKQIVTFKKESKILEAQKDSIVLNHRRAQEEDREELEKIKKDIAKNNDELDRLRKLDDLFDAGEYNTETTLKLRDLIEGASGRLREYRTQ